MSNNIHSQSKKIINAILQDYCVNDTGNDLEKSDTTHR